MGWSLEERGAWFTLVMTNWIEGSLPSDQTALARLLRVDAAAMRGLWSAIGSRFIPHLDFPGRLTSPRLEVERERAVGLVTKRSAAGTKGAIARWNKGKQHHSKRIANAGTAHPDRTRVPLYPDPDPASDPDPDSAGQPKPETLAGESVNLRAFRERLTAALNLPSLIAIAPPLQQAAVIVIFEKHLAAAGPDILLNDCVYLAGKSTTGTPGSLKWFVGWLKAYPLTGVAP
jgi:uncharacterized protein YdaU (DUF1376 family)